MLLALPVLLKPEHRIEVGLAGHAVELPDGALTRVAFLEGDESVKENVKEPTNGARTCLSSGALAASWPFAAIPSHIWISAETVGPVVDIKADPTRAFCLQEQLIFISCMYHNIRLFNLLCLGVVLAGVVRYGDGLRGEDEFADLAVFGVAVLAVV